MSSEPARRKQQGAPKSTDDPAAKSPPAPVPAPGPTHHGDGTGANGGNGGDGADDQPAPIQSPIPPRKPDQNLTPFGAEAIVQVCQRIVDPALEGLV